MPGDWDTDGHWIYCSDYAYEIGLHAIRSEGINRWIEHLQHKKWFDLKSLILFVAAVKKAEEMKLPPLLGPRCSAMEKGFPARL